ncbi:hypothetical protein BJ742DRAFT_797915 [Cladochytrium replicatum]|nr:hypothetical protein BJ742DRAFT_797915 [Cladochytrium replicatum]
MLSVATFPQAIGPVVHGVVRYLDPHAFATLTCACKDLALHRSSLYLWFLSCQNANWGVWWTGSQPPQSLPYPRPENALRFAVNNNFTPLVHFILETQTHIIDILSCLCVKCSVHPTRQVSERHQNEPLTILDHAVHRTGRPDPLDFSKRRILKLLLDTYDVMGTGTTEPCPRSFSRTVFPQTLRLIVQFGDEVLVLKLLELWVRVHGEDGLLTLSFPIDRDMLPTVVKCPAVLRVLVHFVFGYTGSPSARTLGQIWDIRTGILELAMRSAALRGEEESVLVILQELELAESSVAENALARDRYRVHAWRIRSAGLEGSLAGCHAEIFEKLLPTKDSLPENELGLLWLTAPDLTTEMPLSNVYDMCLRLARIQPLRSSNPARVVATLLNSRWVECSDKCALLGRLLDLDDSWELDELVAIASNEQLYPLSGVGDVISRVVEILEKNVADLKARKAAILKMMLKPERAPHRDKLVWRQVHSDETMSVSVLIDAYIRAGGTVEEIDHYVSVDLAKRSDLLNLLISKGANQSSQAALILESSRNGGVGARRQQGAMSLITVLPAVVTCQDSEITPQSQIVWGNGRWS